MKILIVSDSHGNHQYLEVAYQRIRPVDLVIHLGDVEGGTEVIKSIIQCNLEIVAGNNDYFSNLPNDNLLNIGKYKIFITHGHRYAVYYNLQTIKEVAKSRGANIVMYGHTHHPMIDRKDTIWAINPGSISQPRQEGRKPSFIVMDIDRYGEAHFTINYIKR